jgi:hypothetical protein
LEEEEEDNKVGIRYAIYMSIKRTEVEATRSKCEHLAAVLKMESNGNGIRRERERIHRISHPKDQRYRNRVTAKGCPLVAEAMTDYIVRLSCARINSNEWSLIKAPVIITTGIVR